MRKEKILLICTTGYPFGMSEDFLHCEIQILSKSFKKIILVVPDKVSNLPVRDLPDNVDIRFHNTISKYKTLIYPNLWRALFSDWRNGQLKGEFFSKIRIGISFFAQALSIGHQVNQLIQIMKEEVICYSYWFNESALAFTLIDSPNIEKKISRAHGWDLYKERHIPEYLPFRNWIGSRIDQIYCISNVGKQYLIKNYQIPSNKIITSYLGTIKIERNGTTQNEEVLRIISCSNVISLKRVEMIIQVLAKVTCEVEWVHVGDGPLMKDVKEAAQVKLKKNVVYRFLGEIENSEVHKVYSSFNPHLFINLSKSEGIPVSMMEAMSFGVPVIGTNVGGVSEIVDEDNGYLLSANPRAQEIVSVIEKFQQLSNEDKEKKRKAAYSTWENKFNAEKNYTQFVEDILSL